MNDPLLTPIHAQSPDGELLHRYLQTVWLRKWVLVVALVVIPASAYSFSQRQSKVFDSEATLQVEPTGASPAVDFGITTRSLAAASRLAETIAAARDAATRLGPPEVDPRGLRGSTTITTDTEGGLLTITASAGSAQRAADIANAYAGAIQSRRTSQAQAEIDETIGQLRPRIRADAGNRTNSASLPLQQELERLRVARAEQKNRTQVVAPAIPPNSASTPKPLRSAVLALIIAAFVGLGAIFLLDALDRRVREPEELERLVGAPLLGVIPKAAFPRNGKPGWHTDEAVHMLRAQLTYVNIKPVETIIVTSAMSGDGKTTISLNLAIDFARAGKKVILVDADLRRPQLEQRLNATPANRGLVAVLAGECGWRDVLTDVVVDQASFKLLPAGEPPPDPSELMASPLATSLIAELSAQADIVIVDTPPLLVVSDVLPILETVSGVVLAVKMGQTTRKAVAQAANLIVNARGNLVGAVATGTQGPESAYGYYYGSRYAANSKTTESRNGSHGPPAAGDVGAPPGIALPRSASPWDDSP